MSLATVMVVEDERVVAMHLRQQLTRLGYSVPVMATEGRQALQYIRDVRPDVVLMDIHIEGALDGIETAALIPSELHIPVIYLTAYSEESTLERARATKPYGYLLKPFSERELHASIQMVLERRRADNMLRESAQQLEALVQARTAALQTANQDLQCQTQERLNAERALHHVQKLEALGHLTGGIAHDFNNLMQVVIGNLDRLLRLLPQDATSLRATAQHAFEGATRAATFTQRLLAFASRQPLHSKPVSVNELITGMVDLLRRSLGETVSIELKLAQEAWIVEADISQLENSILNLAVNARDAMPGGGSLSIETFNEQATHPFILNKDGSPANEYVRIVMRDDGLGMSDEVAARAFEPFFTTKEVGKGTGLGLSQVYGFVKQSRGHVELDSRPGGGTAVQVCLPRSIGAIARGAKSELSCVPIAGGNETILVVEDDETVRFFSVEALRELSYRVLEAGDGPTALGLLKNLDENIQLLLTDVVLPSGMNGADLAAEALRLRPGLKVLFTTGYDRNALAHLHLETGVQILNKPFVHADLAITVRQALEMSAKV
jgi:signal transduction histidine kinase